MAILKIAIVLDRVVQRTQQTIFVQVPEGMTAVIIPDGVTVNKNDLYDGKVFSVNPKAAELAAVEAKKKLIAEQLLNAKTDAELKAVVAVISDDINQKP